MTAEPIAPGTAWTAGQRRVRRFGATERWLHWSHASAFLAMLATGLVLYLPPLARIFSDRPLVKAIHLVAATAWLTALILIPLLGDRKALRRTRQELERLDDEDSAWLRRRPSRPGRFNAGQKLHAAVQAGLTIVFFVSGALLWLGERNTDLRFSGTIATHDIAMFVGLVFVGGHIYKALAHETRPSLEGMTEGTVPAHYAASHHPRWDPEATPLPQTPPLTYARAATALTIVLLALAAAIFFVADTLG